MDWISPFMRSFWILKIGYRGEVLLLLQKIDASADNGRKTDFTDHVYREFMEYLKGDERCLILPMSLMALRFKREFGKSWQRFPMVRLAPTKRLLWRLVTLMPVALSEWPTIKNH